MQVAIDNAKRRFDIDLAAEIHRIKMDMNISTYKYPSFWGSIKKSFNKKNINKSLICPMNYLCDLKLDKPRNSSSTLQMDYFFNRYELEKDRRTSKKVEEFIEKYSLLLNEYNSSENDDDKYLLLRSNFNSLIEDIQKIYVSKTYLGLFSWLLDRAFIISTEGKKHRTTVKTTIMKNRSLLIKVLYMVNPENLIECFSKNI